MNLAAHAAHVWAVGDWTVHTLYPVAVLPSWSGPRLRGFPVLNSVALPNAGRDLLETLLAPSSWRTTGGVRNALPQFGLIGRAQESGSEPLELLYSPDCFWLWMFLGRRRLLRELPRATNTAVSALLTALWPQPATTSADNCR